MTLSDGTKVDASIRRPIPNTARRRIRADRKKVFDAFWGTWKKYEGTFGASLNTQVLGEEFDAKVRHFPNALSDALFADNMPEAVYRQLVAQANAGLPTFYRYLKLRKKLLGIKDELAYYDIYPSMFTLDDAAAFHGGGFRAHRARRHVGLRPGIHGDAEEGLCGALDGRAAAPGQGVGRLYERLGL